MSTRSALIATLVSGLSAAASVHAQADTAMSPVVERVQFQSDRLPAAPSPRIDIRLWSIAPGHKLSPLKLPFAGLLIVEVRAGSIYSVADGRRTLRRSGELWSVPSGVELHLETTDDMATVQTTVIGR